MNKDVSVCKDSLKETYPQLFKELYPNESVVTENKKIKKTGKEEVKEV